MNHNVYKLLSWNGHSKDITVGNYYVFTRDFTFYDNKNKTRSTKHGKWEKVNNNNFKTGDRVILYKHKYNDDHVGNGAYKLVYGKTYTVKYSEPNDTLMSLEGQRLKHFKDRFVTSPEPLCKEVKGVQPSNTWLDSTPGKVELLDDPPLANSGSNGNYYRCTVKSETTLDKRPTYDAEANDIIETLDMNFAEANAFKAVWRKAAARQGNGKETGSALYDAQKVLWSGERLVAQETPIA